MVTCTKCNTALETEFLNSPGMIHCASCDALLRVEIFPALFREFPSGAPAVSLVLDDEATCFYHPKKKAVVPCAVCGRFLCALCDVEFNGRHVCLTCLETGKKKHKIKNLENHRTLYDTIVLFLAIAPMVFVWPTILTAPMALFMAIRYWKAPTSIIQRTKVRLIIAIFFAVLQIVGWSAFIYSCATR
ncbi:MAG: hypothetical protein JRJ21_00720 [Deltaproteobacteria bacterium]|nr:hypothetical protein [Deltaproteobacteria bacterium]